MRALEHIRRMRGGSQPHLLRCRELSGSDAYYVVKFRENPQHRRLLANEWLAASLARKLGLPVPEMAVINVSAGLIERSSELVIQRAHGRTRLVPGLQFGSRYPGDPERFTVYDTLPEQLLGQVGNVKDFLGMLVFDKWTCNTDKRQVIFCRSSVASPFRALMIDHGLCFNGAEWNFPDAPLRGLYAWAGVYEFVTGIESFEPWLDKLETGLTERDMEEALTQMPSEWYDSDGEPLRQLLNRLWDRRSCVRDLIVAAKDTYRQPFPHWR